MPHYRGVRGKAAASKKPCFTFATYSFYRPYNPEAFRSNRKTATRPASASNSAGVPSRTMPDRFANATPTGTFGRKRP